MRAVVMARQKNKQFNSVAPTPSTIGGGDAAQVRVDREYLAPYAVNPLTQTFPAQPNDPDAPEITFETYRRMMRDGAVSSAVNTLVRMVLADGMQIAPAFAGQQIADDQPAAARALEIADFVRRALSTARKPLPSTLGKLLKGALVYGHKAAEITWKLGEGNDAGKLVLDRVACKPHRLLDFALDAYSEHIGFVPRVSTPADLSGQRILPREKFAVLTLHEEDEDPRGESSLRAAYTPWLFKIHLWPEYLRWLQNCAQNAIIGKLPERKANEITRASVATGAVAKTESEALLETLLELKNASAGVVKHGTEFEQIAASESDGFETGLAVADAQISKSITGQTLASNEAQFGTRAQSETHMGVLDLFVAWLKECLAEMVCADLVRKAIEYNFGPEALSYVPLVSFGDSDRRDWSKDAAAAAMLEGALTDSQWNQITTQLGLAQPLPGERPRRESSSNAATPAQNDAPPNEPKNQPAKPDSMATVNLLRARQSHTGTFITLRSS